MSDIIISAECVLRELRCVLFEIQGKTESVTVGPFILPPGVGDSAECVLRELRCVLFEIQGKTESVTVGPSEECVLRELRCVLFEIQGKTESVTVGPFILPPGVGEYIHYSLSF
ncbi:hypothetical protein V1477_000526 [Vespula maculifrons]|uniref:Uncharacterized protein n=1 Tax=Vespula maculifrons TaxID=7453 RepID=A0ABD2D3V3_VESMC